MRQMIAAALISLISASLAAPTPAAAPDAGEKVNQLIVYGDDPCPPSAEGEITVCARKSESERFRIPAPLRETGDLQKNEAWNNKVLAYETVGSFGTRSCSPVGPGGALGCTERLINKASAEKRGADDIRFSDLIAAEREKRLSTLDNEARETQGRVEQAEREIEARREASERHNDTPTH